MRTWSISAPAARSRGGTSSARSTATGRCSSLLLVNFLLLELINDRRWGAIVSTLLAAAALVVAISDPDAGENVSRRQATLIIACVILAPIVLVVDSAQVIGLAYLLPVALLVCATLPITIVRVLKHQRVTSGDRARRALQLRARRPPVRVHVPGVSEFRDAPFFAQHRRPHESDELPSTSPLQLRSCR